MRLEGLPHITMITAGAQPTADFSFRDPRGPRIHAHLRERFEAILTPLVGPRAAGREKVVA